MIKYLFQPRSFALIGASQNENKIGYKVLKNIISGGFDGRLYSINPKGGEIDGMKVYKSIDDIDDTIDCASLVLPARSVIDAVKDCARKKVKYLQILSSGFSEIGNDAEERKIVSIARASGMRVVGPNMFGIYSSVSSLNSTFSSSLISPGHVAILTQSGALGIAMIGKTAVENIGLSAIVSIGNKCDIDESDLLEYLTLQEETKVIFMYMEGIKKGERLIEALKNATKKKPVIVLKSGGSTRGALAAASHTGSLAVPDEIFGAIMKQCGVLKANNLEEAFNWCKFLAESPKPMGFRNVILTNGGGIGVLAADACEKQMIGLYDDQSYLHNLYKSVVPPFGSTKNPIDITGGAKAEDYNLALSVNAGSENIDSTIALYCETAVFDSGSIEEMITRTYKMHKERGKPIVYVIVGGVNVENSVNRLKNQRIPVYNEVDHAVSCLGASCRFYGYLNDRSDDIEVAEINDQKINNIIDYAINDGRTFLLAHEGASVMEAARITMPINRIAHSLHEALQYAEEIGYPIVMKVVSRDILHKSDVGGVMLDLLNRDEVIDAYEAIIHKCKAYNPNAIIDGIEVCQMAAQGIELILGARRDPSFGPIVMCGLGGIYVEFIKDVSFRAIPLNRSIAMSMLEETIAYSLLLGARGEKKKDIDAVVDSIIKIGTIIEKCDKISDIEINPIVVYDENKGLKALDARILIYSSMEAR
ncbi:MAG: acetate--CoA ligase family protein [Spirochaetota bacterium]|nr:acetate--CoA ligase family protein [Spirochaetota bacterium]